ncbi:hypothetical protein [Propionivibrio sp.]|uniref:hypothetical protein n=1 Tax=Propionivibrio sp. TaxID=2212460 RepID=UPI003BF32180
MAKTDSVLKTVNYRRSSMGPDQTRDLQQMLEAALVKFPKPADRYEPLNTQSTELRCIGMHEVRRGCLCGFMTSFERGATQPAISDDMVASSLRLSALAPPAPNKGDAQKEYVPGLIYFVVHKNHVAFVTTHAMRGHALELHLNWLLKSKSSELNATVPFSLSDEAQKATKEKIKKSHVKAISFGQPLMAEVEVPVDCAVSAPEVQRIQTRKKKASPSFKTEGPMLNFIRSFFSDQGQFETLGLDEVFDGNLEVWIEIRYPKRKRSNPEDAIKLMDTLGIALRDVEGNQVALRLKNGHQVSGNDLKISGSIEITLSAEKLPITDVLLDLMVSWLSAQIKNGVIDP